MRKYISIVTNKYCRMKKKRSKVEKTRIIKRIIIDTNASHLIAHVCVVAAPDALLGLQGRVY